MHDTLYWDSRYPLGRSDEGAHPVRSKHFSGAALERSLIALFARREVARQADCPKRSRYGNPWDKSWQIHDEPFYKYGFDVPLPQFLQEACRARWLRIPESELPLCHRIPDELHRQRRWRSELRERRHAILGAGGPQSSRDCIAGGA